MLMVDTASQENFIAITEKYNPEFCRPEKILELIIERKNATDRKESIVEIVICLTVVSVLSETNTAKVVQRVQENQKDYVNKLITDMNIRSKASAGSANTITFARIQKIFSSLTYKVFCLANITIVKQFHFKKFNVENVQGLRLLLNPVSGHIVLLNRRYIRLHEALKFSMLVLSSVYQKVVLDKIHNKKGYLDFKIN